MLRADHSPCLGRDSSSFHWFFACLDARVVECNRLLRGSKLFQKVDGGSIGRRLSNLQRRLSTGTLGVDLRAMGNQEFDHDVRRLLALRPRLYPQFATHNALTVASVIEDAGGGSGYEFQRLHGMGEALYEALLAELPEVICRVYAPVGGHSDLLAYLVRRLLENGANSSFVSVAADPAAPIEVILRRPQSLIGNESQARHPHIPLPRDLFGPERRNSAGIEFGDRASLEALLADIRASDAK